MTGLEYIGAIILGFIGTAVWLYIYNKYCDSFDSYPVTLLAAFTILVVAFSIAIIGCICGARNNIIPFTALGTAATFAGYFIVLLYFFLPPYISVRRLQC